MDSNNQDIFSQFHSFLGMFHSSERTGVGTDQAGLVGLMDQVFPGIGGEVNKAMDFMKDTNSPFASLFKDMVH